MTMNEKKTQKAIPGNIDQIAAEATDRITHIYAASTWRVFDAVKSAIEKATSEYESLIAFHEARATAKDDIRGFIQAILHGDFKHREWLVAAGEAHIAGKEIPKCPCQHEADESL